MPTPDPFHLQRFLDAQATTYPQARAELAAGQKRSHWMWFIFPQIQGLGSSPMAQRYAITDLAEARAYLAHPTLGPRLRECTALVHAIYNRDLEGILGYPDNLKFHSSITLFQRAASAPEDEIFTAALTHFFPGPDPRHPQTLDRPSKIKAEETMQSGPLAGLFYCSKLYRRPNLTPLDRYLSVFQGGRGYTAARPASPWFFPGPTRIQQKHAPRREK